MPWFRVDDGFNDHPKVAKLRRAKGGERALCLWLFAGVWCAKQMTDGAVPDYMVVGMGYRPADAQALVSAGLWKVVANGYRFHDWARCNETRDQIERRREATRNRVRKRRGNGVTSAVTNGDSTQKVTVTGGSGSGLDREGGAGGNPTGWDWREEFAAAWLGKFGRFYGHSGDSKAAGALSALLEAWPEAQQREAWEARGRMISAFFDEKTEHIFAFFVPRFLSLLNGKATKKITAADRLRAEREARNGG